MKRKISIHDIARELKISATTVSFVLNGKAEEKRISEAVRKKILKHIDKVGYRPNMVAKSLRTGKTKIIGMLIEDISDPFFSSISRKIEIKANKLGYKIFFSSTENNTEKTKDLINVLREWQVDAFIIAPPPGIENEVKDLMNDKIPVVFFDRFYKSLKVNATVVVDNYMGAFIGTTHLIENGYKNVGLITLESDQTQMQDRLNGYKDAVKSAKGISKICKVPYSTDTKINAAVIKTFLSENIRLDAVLFATNYLAISGLDAMKKLKLKIPSDIALVGFDDNNHFALFSPSISAVAQPVQDISNQVIRLLFECLTERTDSLTYQKEIVVLPPKLIERGSSVKKII